MASQINADGLCAAVVHWLEYQRLCLRRRMLTELTLRMPIGEYFISNKNRVLSEKTCTRNGVRVSFDYVLSRKPRTVTDVIELKFVNGKPRPGFAREVSRDILSLSNLDETASWNQNERCSKWLVIAGMKVDIDTHIHFRQYNMDGNRVLAFENILPSELRSKKKLQMYITKYKSNQPFTRKYKKIAEELGLNELVSGVCGELLATYPNTPSDKDYVCKIWRISLPQGCGGVSLDRCPI